MERSRFTTSTVFYRQRDAQIIACNSSKGAYNFRIRSNNPTARVNDRTMKIGRRVYAENHEPADNASLNSVPPRPLTKIGDTPDGSETELDCNVVKIAYFLPTREMKPLVMTNPIVV